MTSDNPPKRVQAFGADRFRLIYEAMQKHKPLPVFEPAKEKGDSKPEWHPKTAEAAKKPAQKSTKRVVRAADPAPPVVVQPPVKAERVVLRPKPNSGLVLDWKKVAAESRNNTAYARPYSNCEVKAVVYMRDELSMGWGDICREFGRSSTWIIKLYKLSNLIDAVWDHTRWTLPWRERLENNEVYSLSFQPQEKQEALMKKMLASHAEDASYFDKRTWRKVENNGAVIKNSAATLRQALTSAVLTDLLAIGGAEGLKDVREDLVAAQADIDVILKLLQSKE